MASTNTSGGWDGFLQNTVNGRRYFNNKTFDARAFTYSFINKTNPQRLQYSGATVNVAAANTSLSAAMIKNKIAVQAAATNLNLTTIVAVDASVTLYGAMGVNSNESGRFRIVNSTVDNNAVNIYRIG